MNGERFLLEFAYLHAHSEYSLKDGSMTVGEYLDRLLELDIPAAALTDTHNLFGAFGFHEQALSRGIKPVIGVDLRISPFAPSSRSQQARCSRVRVLVENEHGYRRLSHLLSESYRNRGNSPPAVPVEQLGEDTEGLYILGPEGPGAEQPPDKISQDMLCDSLDRSLERFGDALYCEIPLYPSFEEWASTRVDLARERSIPCVPTRPAYVPTPGEESRMRLRKAVQMNRKLSDMPPLPSHRTRQFVTDPDRLQSLAERVGVSLSKSHELANACYFEFETDQFRLPAYPYAEDSPGEDLEARCEQAIRREQWDVGETRCQNRLDHELQVIRKMGFADYFLIVADVIQWAHEQGIRVGPGRGSSAGSLVAYLLGITTVNPFEFDLVFERFLNPQRNEMPDIDIDFADNRRGEVIDYIRRRFGEESVAHIITFGRMKARNSIRDIGRVRGESQERIDRIAEMIPSTTNDPLSRLRKQVEELKNKIHSEPEIHEWIDQSQQLEGLVRNPSIHAAGILILEGRIDHEIPLYWPSGGDTTAASQYDMYDVEKLGYLKLDILGLKTLTQIEKTLEQIPIDQRPDCDQIPDEDPRTLELFAQGQLEGVFQYESEGSRQLVRKMKPENRRDIVDCIALYRPGPMEIRDDYLKRRQNPELIDYPHENLKPILEDTYGLILYQEQVMAIAREIGGFSWAEADTLRKAMGKKKTELMNQMEQQFIEGAEEKGYELEWARDLFDTLAQFAEYGFNRSHSAAYGEITYTTAYLKAHFPAAFYAGFMTIKSDDRDRLARIESAMREENVQLLGPDVNRSSAEFTVENGAVRYGLQAIKHVGTNLVEAIEAEQETNSFADLLDFVERIDPQHLHARAFQMLAAAGTFDRFDIPRGWIVDQAESLLKRGKKRYRELESGQSNLFRSDEETVTEETFETRSLQPESRWTKKQRLRTEKQALGFILESSPGPSRSFLQTWSRLTYPGELETFGDLVSGEVPTGELPFQLLAEEVDFVSENGEQYLRLRDEHEEILLRFDPENGDKITDDCPGFLIFLAFQDEWVARRIQPIRQPETIGLEIRLPLEQNINELKFLRSLLSRHSGKHPVRLRVSKENQRLELRQTVDLNEDLAEAIKGRYGERHTSLFIKEKSPG